MGKTVTRDRGDSLKYHVLFTQRLVAARRYRLTSACFLFGRAEPILARIGHRRGCKTMVVGRRSRFQLFFATHSTLDSCAKANSRECVPIRACPWAAVAW